MSGGPWREVMYIGDLKTGPHGGESRLLDLSCGHLFAWRNPIPKGLGVIFGRLRFVPHKVRCLLCDELIKEKEG